MLGGNPWFGVHRFLVEVLLFGTGILLGSSCKDYFCAQALGWSVHSTRNSDRRSATLKECFQHPLPLSHAPLATPAVAADVS